MEVSTPLVKNILLLDLEGKRVAVKYFSDDWPTLAAKLGHEKSIFTKTSRANARTEADIVVTGWSAAEIGMYDGYVVVYKFINDLYFYVTGGEDENELILSTVLTAFFEAVNDLLRGNVDKRTVLENLDLILLCLDEIVDGGIILETEPSVIAGRVAMRGADSDLPLSEQTTSTFQVCKDSFLSDKLHYTSLEELVTLIRTISQALATAKEHLARSLLK